MGIELTIDQRGLAKFSRFGQQIQKQLPFAASVALNALGSGASQIPGSRAKSIVTALAGASRGYFDQPTKFVQNGWFATKAKKSNLQIVIHPKDKQLPYLKAHITGGARSYKPFEPTLLSIGSAQTQALIPSFVKRNSAGNVTRNTIGKIIANQKITGPGSVFIGIPRGGSRKLGVYERTRTGTLKPLFVAKPRAYYNGRFPLAQTAQTVYTRRFNEFLYLALQKSLASARR